MNTIKATMRINEYTDIGVRNLTPAEAVLLREIHAPSLAQQSRVNPSDDPKAQAACWGFLTNIAPDGVAVQRIPNPEYDGENEKVPEFIERPRTNAEEVSRLRAKYLQRAKSGAQGSHLLDDIYPGKNPDLPETFEEIGLFVAAPAEPEKQKRKNKKTEEEAGDGKK